MKASMLEDTEEECRGGPSEMPAKASNSNRHSSDLSQALGLMENDACCGEAPWLSRPQGHLDMVLRSATTHLQFYFRLFAAVSVL